MEEEKVSLKNKWKSELRDRKFRISFFISILLLALVLFSLTRFLNYAEDRNGIIIPDPVLSMFHPIDLTWFIFGIIYLSLLCAIFSLIPHPRHLLFAIQLYASMVFVRIIAMYLMPLNPPEGMITLKDPFVEIFGSGKTLTKDLFFSGHTASILIFFLTAKNKIFKTFFLVLIFLIAVLVILQKVHYTIDVYAAVFFTLTCYFILKEIKIKFNI